MTSRRFNHLVALAAAAATVVPAGARAQSALPAAREIVARHVEAIGGRALIEARRSLRARGTFEMPAMGVRGEFDMAQSRTGGRLMTVSLPGLGDIKSGFDGTTAWSMNPMMGPRILEGREAAEIRDESDMLSVLREPPAVSSIETVADTTVEGQRCYKVRVSWASGRRSFDCYSVETGLLVAQLMTQESPMGALDIVSTVGEYRDFAGVKIATLVTVKAAGQEQVVRVSTVDLDNVDEAVFGLPAQIAALRPSRGSAAPRR